MPGETPYEAFEEFVRPLRLSLSCVSKAVLRHYGEIVPNVPISLVVPDEPIHLTGKSDLGLLVRQKFQIVEHATQSAARPWWRVHTLAYHYQIDEWNGHEIMAYHWHPEGASPTKLPHLHLRAGARIGRAELQKAHIPTDRIAMEDVIRFLIEEFGVTTLRKDWPTILDETAELFRRYATW